MMKEQIKEFIENNKLSFYEGERNQNLTVICGYGLHIGIKDFMDVYEGIPERYLSTELYDECQRVFRYAQENNYQNWWKSTTAKNTWKF